MSPPLFVLGVNRSGTTLLRVILDRSAGIAIPEESRFIPLLARRHRRAVDVDDFRDDLSRIPELVRWGLDPADVVLHPGMTTPRRRSRPSSRHTRRSTESRGGATRARSTCAIWRWSNGSSRTPSTSISSATAGMPRSRSPRCPSGRTRGRGRIRPARPASPGSGSPRFAPLESSGGASARRATSRCATKRSPRSPRRRSGQCAGSRGFPSTCRCSSTRTASTPPTGPSTAGSRCQPTPGLRDWRAEMSAEDVLAFEELAGDLLAELGYEVRTTERRRARAALSLGTYRARIGLWDGAAAAVQRSPLWRRRHPPLAGLGAGRVPPAERDDASVQREVVRPLGRRSRASSGPSGRARRARRRSPAARTSACRGSRRRRSSRPRTARRGSCRRRRCSTAPTRSWRGRRGGGRRSRRRRPARSRRPESCSRGRRPDPSTPSSRPVRRARRRGRSVRRSRCARRPWTRSRRSSPSGTCRASRTSSRAHAR